MEEIRPGDRLVFAPGEEHWHGATPGRFPVHVAMADVDEADTTVKWGVHLTDEEDNQQLG